MRVPLAIATALLILGLSSLGLSGCSEPAAPPKNVAKPHLVEVVTLSTQTLAIERERTGTLRALQEIQIHNQEEGRITALPFYAGDRVRKGDLVVHLDDRQLRAQLARSQALRSKAEKDLTQIKELISKRLTSQTDLTRAETALAVAYADERILLTRLEDTTLHAPITGVVSQRLSEPGNIAERYTHLLTLSDQRTLITDVAVSELLINKLHPGDKVAISIDALGSTQLGANQHLQGSITRIYPNLDPVTRTGTVEIGLNPPPQGARPGQLVRVRLRTEEAERLLIPFTALRRSAEGEYLFTLDQDQAVQLTPVITGLRIGEQLEILSGATAGTIVVIRGFTNLRAGARVTPVEPSTPRETPPAMSATQ